MRNKLYWGLGILIVLLIGAFVFMMVNTQSEIRQLAAELKEAQELKDSIHHSKPENRPPPPGKSFEGGGHWHGDEWHDAPHEPSIANGTNTEHPTQATHPVSTYKGPLTYHKELLEIDPARALRELSKEMNHWSAEYIPEIPPDDEIATEYARVEYLKAYIRATGVVPEGVNPQKLDEKFEELHRKHNDLWYSKDGIINWQDPNNPASRFTKLTWIGLEPPLRWDEDGDPLWW